jgi:hypothetical protein
MGRGGPGLVITVGLKNLSIIEKIIINYSDVSVKQQIIYYYY